VLNTVSRGKAKPTVCSSFSVETTLPSTFSLPVPPRATPLTLLYARVPAPSPSYLKSNSIVGLLDKQLLLLGRVLVPTISKLTYALDRPKLTPADVKKLEEANRQMQQK
jgi:hypothetical protein